MAWRVHLEPPPKDSGYIAKISADWTGPVSEEDKQQTVQQIVSYRMQIKRLRARLDGTLGTDRVEAKGVSRVMGGAGNVMSSSC